MRDPIRIYHYLARSLPSELSTPDARAALHLAELALRYAAQFEPDHFHYFLSNRDSASAAAFQILIDELNKDTPTSPSPAAPRSNHASQR